MKSDLYDPTDTVLLTDQRSRSNTSSQDSSQVNYITFTRRMWPRRGNRDENKGLGVFPLFLFVFFLTSGGAYGLEDIGSTVPPLYALLGIIFCPWLFAMPLALLTAELTSAMPVREGFVFWTQKAFGEWMGFFEGWLLVLITMIDKTIYPVILISYMKSLFPNLVDYWVMFGLNFAFIAVGFVMAISGPRVISFLLTFFGLGVIVPTGIFTVLCFTTVDSTTDRFERWIDTTSPVDTSDIMQGISLYTSILLWIYSRYDYSGFLAYEISKPTNTYPKSLILSVVVTMFVYLLPFSAAIYLTNNPNEYWEGSFSEIAKKHFVDYQWLVPFLIVGALFSNLGTYFTSIYTSANGLFSVSEKGDCPLCFSKELPWFPDRPFFALLFYSITTQFWPTYDFPFILELETVLYCVHVLILIGTFFKLRHSHPDMERPFRVPGSNFAMATFYAIPIIIALWNIATTNLIIIGVAFLSIAIILDAYLIKIHAQACIAIERM